MKTLQRFVQERNEALFSLDKDKIKAYMRKYNVPVDNYSDDVFWASVYKAICNIKDAPEPVVNEARTWLNERGYRTTVSLLSDHGL